MEEYARTKVDNMVSVVSIATALRVDLRNRVAGDDQHSFPEIAYIAEGQSVTLVDGIKHSLNAGDMIIYAPNAIHGGGTGCVVKVISFETEAPLPDALLNRVITLTGQRRVQLEDLIDSAIPLFMSSYGVRGMVLKKGADPYYLQSIKNKLELFLLDLLSPGKSAEGNLMRSVTAYMNDHLDCVLTLQQLCDDLGISLPALKRLLKNTYGISPMAYFSELKIEEAKRLIADTALNITEVAERLGFSSVHHFSGTFKKKTGMSPTEYKKASRD